MPDDDKPKKPIYTSYVFPNPGPEPDPVLGGGGGNIAMLGGKLQEALYVVLTYEYEDPPIIDLNTDANPPATK